MKEKKLNPLILNINTYSHYSLLSSALSIDQIIDFALSENKKYVALTDNNLYGAMDFYLKCKKKNLIPVIGLSLNFLNNDFVIYAKNKNGYINLVKISSLLLSNNLDFDISQYLNDVFIIYKNKDFNIQTTANKYFYQDIAFNESRFLSVNDKKIFNALQKIKNNQTCTIDELNVGLDLHLLNETEFTNRFNENQIELLNKEILDVNLEIEFEKNNIIEYKNNENLSSKQYLNKLCLNGLNEKILNEFISSEDKQKYLNRIDEELNVIDSMGFNDYFLVVQDFVKEAKNRNILVGPGRGSAAGSLIAYLLGITEVDPIKNNLLFERFLNPGRISMPDIDIDIMDSRRDEIIEYIFQKYGHEHVAHIVTFQRIKAKMAIRDVGRILNKDLKEINKICKLITAEFDEDLLGSINNNKELKKYAIDYQDLFEISNGIIGCPRQIGLHAAGIVLSKKPLNEIVPTQMSVNGEIATQFSMEYLEDLGLIKMDLLGLTNLTTIYNVLKLIKIIHKINIDLTKVKTDDQKVFEDARNGYTLGIFQLESPGMTSTVKKVKPVSIEDISICSALFRPGPMQNIKVFVDRRNKTEKVEYIDPKNKEILEPTYGIIVYQEQVIELVKKIANFSPYEADMFRRMIAKKDATKLESFKAKFFENAIKNGYVQEELEKIYTYIYTFADYGFNHSHSFAYSLISYWLLYLKHYFPTEFMTVLMMSVEGNMSKTPIYVNECKRLKIDVLPPSINYSEKSLSLYKRKVLFGLSSIKGIGEETSKKIISIRSKQKNKFESYVDSIKMLANSGIGISTLETLIYAGCFDEFKQSRKYMLANLKDIVEVSSMLNSDNSFKFEPRLVEVEKETTQETQEFGIKQESLIGIDFSLKKEVVSESEISEKYSQYDIKPINEIKDNDVFFDSIITIKSFAIKKTKKGTDMLFVKVVDIYNNMIEACSFTKALIESIANYDSSKKYLATFKTSSFRLTLIKIKEEVE